MLNQQEGDRTIEHVSGFNLVPPEHHAISGFAPRLSRYPESYAWATWERAWTGYDDGLTWALNATVSDIHKIVGTRMGPFVGSRIFLTRPLVGFLRGHIGGFRACGPETVHHLSRCQPRSVWRAQRLYPYVSSAQVGARADLRGRHLATADWFP